MGTQASQLNNFLRAWNVSIQTQSGDIYTIASGTDETLRIRFEIESYLLMVYQTCTLTIYNMSNQTASAITQGTPNAQQWNFAQPISAGNTVTISAGYQYGSSGAFQPKASIIYKGQILQASWLRENVVDTKLVLRCVTGLVQDALNFVNLSLSKGGTDLDILNRITQQANIPFPSNNLDSSACAALSQNQYPRGQTLNGRPYHLIRTILKQKKLHCWVENTGLNIRAFSASDTPPAPSYAYGPIPQPGGVSTSNGQPSGNTPLMPTLIGVPEQTQCGIVFRVLLDSTPKIGGTVQLAPGTIINPVALQFGTMPPIPTQNGIYYVAGMRFFGDSRGHGEDWFTEITGVVPNFFSFIEKASVIQ